MSEVLEFESLEYGRALRIGQNHRHIAPGTESTALYFGVNTGNWGDEAFGTLNIEQAQDIVEALTELIDEYAGLEAKAEAEKFKVGDRVTIHDVHNPDWKIGTAVLERGAFGRVHVLEDNNGTGAFYPEDIQPYVEPTTLERIQAMEPGTAFQFEGGGIVWFRTDNRIISASGTAFDADRAWLNDYKIIKEVEIANV